jgi:hypothetical protein
LTSFSGFSCPASFNPLPERGRSTGHIILQPRALCYSWARKSRHQSDNDTAQKEENKPLGISQTGETCNCNQGQGDSTKKPPVTPCKVAGISPAKSVSFFLASEACRAGRPCPAITRIAEPSHPHLGGRASSYPPSAIEQSMGRSLLYDSCAKR